MPQIERLPRELENGAAILKRREKAASLKELWRDTYREVFEYCMPQRETFSWHAPGQKKTVHLYDSTGQHATYTAANNMQALLCPSWKHWSMLAPGGDITAEEAENPEITDGLQEATETAFHYLNHSNFSTTISETFLDLMAGTGALSEDEGEPDNPLVFDAVPLSILELEEGPMGSIETTFMRRTPLARNLMRMYRGMTKEHLPAPVNELINKKPDTEVPIIQGLVYYPKNRRYYGVALHEGSKQIIWRYDYEDSSPMIVARAAVISGEIYGRGRAMVALPDIKTLNTMQEYLLRHSAMVVAPPITGISDSVFNPYTAQLVPNTIIPVGSNANDNPTLRVLELGGNFAITDAIMEQLRASVRTTLMGPRRTSTDRPPQFAIQLAQEDRDRMLDAGAEFGRIQAELLSKIMSRTVWILQKHGKIPPIKVDGRQVTLKYVSPLARAQDQEDLLALQQSFELAAAAAKAGGEAGQLAMAMGWKYENLPAWLSKRTGLDADLVRTDTQKKQMTEQISAGMAQIQQAQGGGGNVVPMRPRRAA
jgi:hypothetical protein